MLKAIGTGVLGVFTMFMSGLVAAGDRTIHVATAIVANEFFMMIATIIAFVMLMKM